MGKRADVVEKEWLDRVHRIRCVVCVHLGVDQTSRTEAHHPYEGQGLSQRAEHCGVAALCGEHHRGANGIGGLGTRGFRTRYKLDEVDLIQMTIYAVFADVCRQYLGIRPPRPRERSE